MSKQMDRFVVLVFKNATALIIDAEPLIVDGCTDELHIEQWAVEKFANGRETYNLVFMPAEANCKAYINRFGYEEVKD